MTRGAAARAALSLELQGAPDSRAEALPVCIYISRYAPERSPTDPYTGLPLHLSRNTDFTGMWGRSRNLDPAFRARCREIFEAGPGWRGWLGIARRIVGLSRAGIEAGFVVCGIDEYSLSLGVIAGAVLQLDVYCFTEDPPFTSRYDRPNRRARRLEKAARTALLRRLLPRCRALFCYIERDILQEFLVPGPKVHQMMNSPSVPALEWADARSSRAACPTRPAIGFVGAIDPAQGVDGLLEIFALARRLVPGMRLQLIGPLCESYAPRFRSRLRDLGIAEVVDVTGWLPYAQMLERLDSCYAGVYCCPASKWFLSAQPLKICEYLALRKPAVAWDYPGARRLLDNGRLGILVAPGDKMGFAQAIARLACPEARGAYTRRIEASLQGAWNGGYWHAQALETMRTSLHRRP